MVKKKKNNDAPKGPKVLLFDIETAPILAYVWGLWNNDVGLNQIVSDWHVLSVAAKWLGDSDDKIMYMDQRNAKNIEDDKVLLRFIWNLLNEADIVITQNGKKFDVRKLNARFVMNGMQPPSSYRHIDTAQIASKYFGFTSRKLEYMTGKLCKKYKKSSHSKFPGMSLWDQCLKGNKEAWEEMETYNKFDVLSLEELYTVLIAWDNSINFDVYHNDYTVTCKCGDAKFKKNGFFYSNTGKYQRFKCVNCGSESRSKENMLTKEKRSSLRR